MSDYELIDMLRNRTAMYTGHASPTHLRAFLSGYNWALRNESPKQEEPDFHGFHDWVAEKLNYKESPSRL